MKLRPYKKPELPPEGIPWLMVDENGEADGPFYSESLERSTLPGKPYGFADGLASPRVLRVRRQRGNRLELEDGVFLIFIAPEAPTIAGWPKVLSI